MEGNFMTIINLRNIYPQIYKKDYFIDVSDEIIAFLKADKCKDNAYKRRTYRYYAYYSLDRGDNIEFEALDMALSLADICEQKEQTYQLYAAFNTLSPKQAKRIYAYFFLEMSMNEIARAEGVKKSQITRSIFNGLTKMKKYLQEFL